MALEFIHEVDFVEIGTGWPRDQPACESRINVARNFECKPYEPRRAYVGLWPITTFRCAGQFGRYREHSGLWPAERPVDLWVHGLVKCPAEELPPSDRRAYVVVRC